MSAVARTVRLDADVGVDRSAEFTLDVSVHIEPGETLAVLGPNGAGKSTLVDAMAGLLPLTEGLIELGGRVLDDGTTFVPPERRRIGVVFQEYLLFDHLSVRDNIAFGCTNPTVADSVAERLVLTDLLDRRPPELSGGQAQRVALARALATEPDLLLLDEPLAALDVERRSATRRLLRSAMTDFAGPRLLITHDPTDAFLLADRIAVIEAGRLTQSGSPDQIRQHPATPYVAAVAGTNLLTGVVDHDGAIAVDGHRQGLQTSDTSLRGPVLVTIHPRAIALHDEEPHGSPRNTWHSRVTGIEPLGDTTRILLHEPLPLAVDITPASTTALDLHPGSEVWVSVKATEVRISPSG